ncbi:hypothetical protein FQN50_009901 [Emmonsiellopsis sp. PD_5]|nr:hypothetical protein FQN50_009901 [Emmonsiellopsis sp. PD_5]
MPYYEKIKNRSAFVRYAESDRPKSFAMLKDSDNWETAASKWGTAQLYACRVICKEPRDILPLLAGIIPSKHDPSKYDPLLKDLIKGPENLVAPLQQMAEIQIVRAYENESLGYVWAALARLLKSNAPESSELPPEKSKRERSQVGHEDYVPSDELQIGSSPPGGCSDSSSSNNSTIGYVGKSPAQLVEDYTVRFLSCLTRCVLNYGQSLSKQTPFIQYRDGRLEHVYKTLGSRAVLYKATDDGGVQLEGPGGDIQVALLEAKRCFLDIKDGKVRVPDELLAQVVAEALAARKQGTENISADSIVSIVAVQHYIKFFHFHITDDFLRQFETLDPTDDNREAYLQVDSTDWFDMSQQKGRKKFVRHILGLVAWADAIQEESSDPMQVVLN